MDLSLFAFERGPIGLAGRFVEAGEDHGLRLLIPGEMRADLGDGDLRRHLSREAVNAGGDRREGDRAKASVAGERQTGPVATRQMSGSPTSPPRQIGPTVWMTCPAGKRYPRVSRASPGGQPPSVRHSASSSGPAARWIAPSTPPPPSSEVLAALTIASTVSRVMSPSSIRIRPRSAFSLAIARCIQKQARQRRRRLAQRPIKPAIPDSVKRRSPG